MSVQPENRDASGARPADEVYAEQVAQFADAVATATVTSAAQQGQAEVFLAGREGVLHRPGPADPPNH